MATTVFDLQAILGIDTSKFEQGLSKARSMASTMGSKLGSGLTNAAKAGAAAIGAATTAVTAFGVSSVKTGAEFDKSMSQVAATMGVTTDEIGKLRDFAMQMGASTAFSAKQAADALNYMALAGYDAQTSMDMLPNVLNLAAAGAMDLAKASDMITDTQTAFGLSLERTTQMVDEMAKAASTGNTNVEQLGEAFLVVGGLAQELNGGFVTLKDGTNASVDGLQEMEIALTAMANAGIKGSSAGTHMRNMIMKLSNPTSDGAKTMQKLGIEVFNAEGKMRSLADIMGDLSVALGNVTQEEKIQAISDLFNARDLASAEALLNAVNQDWNKIGESILNADGAAEKMAKTQLDNLAGDVTILKSAFEGLQIVISDSLSPSLRNFVQLGTRELGNLNKMFSKFDDKPYKDTIAKLRKEGANAQAKYVEDQMKAARKAFAKEQEEAMEDLFRGVSDGVGMIVDLIPDMVTYGTKLLSAIGKGIIDNQDVLIDSALRVVGYMGKAIAEGLPQALDFGLDFFEQLFSSVSENKDEIKTKVVELIENLSSTLSEHLQSLSGEDIADFADIAISILGALANALIENVAVIISRLPEIISAISEAMANNPEAMGAIGTIWAMHIATGMAGSLLSNLGSMVLPVISNFLTADIGALCASGGAAAGLTCAAGIAGAIVAFFAGAEIGKQIGAMIFPDDADLYEHYAGLSGTLQMFKDLWYVITSEIGYKWMDLKNTIKTACDNIGEAWRILKEMCAIIWDAINAKVVETWDNIKNKVTTTVENVKNTVIDGFKSFVSTVKSTLDDLYNKVKTVFDNIKKVIEEAINKIKTFGSGIFDNISDAIDKLRDKIGGLKDAVPSIGGGGGGAKSNVSSASPQSATRASAEGVYNASTATNVTSSSTNVDRAMIDSQNIVVNVALEGGADRLFRVVKAEAVRNEQMTGTPAFSL